MNQPLNPLFSQSVGVRSGGVKEAVLQNFRSLLVEIDAHQRDAGK